MSRILGIISLCLAALFMQSFDLSGISKGLNNARIDIGSLPPEFQKDALRDFKENLQRMKPQLHHDGVYYDCPPAQYRKSPKQCEFNDDIDKLNKKHGKYSGWYPPKAHCVYYDFKGCPKQFEFCGKILKFKDGYWCITRMKYVN